MLYAIVGMLVVILDQIVKYWVDKNITPAAPVRELISGVISLVRVQNDGAAFSFLSGGGARIWFIILTGVFTLLVILALATGFIRGRFGRWCLVLVTAGGLANCLDRVLYGYVLDMFRVDLFDFAVFNVADIFITVFCILFILYILFGGEKESEPDADEFDNEDIEERVPVKVPEIKKAKKAKKIVYDDDEDDEDDDEIPARKTKPAKPIPTLNKKKTPVNPVSAAASTPAATPVRKDRVGERMKAPNSGSLFDSPDSSNDPFAEWEKANARVGEGGKPMSAAQKAADELSSQFTAVPESIEKPVAKPAAPKPEKVSDDFDLDSILNEFM